MLVYVGLYIHIYNACDLVVDPCISRMQCSGGVIYSLYDNFGWRITECKVFKCDDCMKAFSLCVSNFLPRTFNALDIQYAILTL
jgi:hypothetical protein